MARTKESYRIGPTGQVWIPQWACTHLNVARGESIVYHYDQETNRIYIQKERAHADTQPTD